MKVETHLRYYLINPNGGRQYLALPQSTRTRYDVKLSWGEKFTVAGNEYTPNDVFAEGVYSSVEATVVFFALVFMIFTPIGSLFAAFMAYMHVTQNNDNNKAAELRFNKNKI